MDTKLCFIFMLIIASSTAELLCYSCISQGGGDDTCITNPQAASNPIVKCKYRYCTIRRLEYAQDAGTIFSFLRGCEDEPLSNGRHPGEDIVVWAQSCQWDRCNLGDGLLEITPGGGGGGGGGGTIIIPDTSGGPNALQSTSVCLIISILTFWMGMMV